MLVPPSIVSEVLTNADATLTPTARDKLDLRVAKRNVNLCGPTVAGAATARYQRRSLVPVTWSGLSWELGGMRPTAYRNARGHATARHPKTSTCRPGRCLPPAIGTGEPSKPASEQGVPAR